MVLGPAEELGTPAVVLGPPVVLGIVRVESSLFPCVELLNNTRLVITHPGVFKSSQYQS